MAGDRDPKAEKTFREFGVIYEFRPDVPPSSFDVERSQANQVRLGAVIDTPTAEKYTEDMLHGHRFPPVWAYRAKSGKLVVGDGNTRLVAAINANGALLDTYIVEGDPDVLTQLFYTANRNHGRPHSAAEMEAHALWMVEKFSMTPADACRQTGAPIKRITKALAQLRANDRAARYGIPPKKWQDLGTSVQSRLNNIKTGEGFAPATTLAIDARLSVEDVNLLVVRLNEEDSGARQQELVASVRAGMADRINAVATGRAGERGAVGGGLAGQLGRCLGQVLTLPESDILDAAIGTAARHDLGQRLDAAIIVLENIRKALAQ